MKAQYLEALSRSDQALKSIEASDDYDWVSQKDQAAITRAVELCRTSVSDFGREFLMQELRVIKKEHGKADLEVKLRGFINEIDKPVAQLAKLVRRFLEMHQAHVAALKRASK